MTIKNTVSRVFWFGVVDCSELFPLPPTRRGKGGQAEIKQ